MTQTQLRPIRLKLGLTLEKLSQMTGISQPRLSNIENGANVTIETLEKIVSALNHQIQIRPNNEDARISL